MIIYEDSNQTISAKEYGLDDVWQITINTTNTKYSFWINEERISELAENLLKLVTK